jgi:hypothetical protein
MQVLSREDMQRLLIQAKEEGYYEIFLLALSTGLRRGEIVALQWNDIDFIAGTISINKQATIINGKMEIQVPKTKSSIRTIALPPSIIEILKEYKSTAESRWLFPSPVFEDMPLRPDGIRNRFSLILQHADCKQYRLHDLRHTFATNALKYGMDIKTLSAVLGHKSSGTTIDVYAHTTTEMQKKAALSIDRGITKSETDSEGHKSVKEAPSMTDFQPYKGKRRKSGTGCLYQINEHLWEGKYSPTWIDGKKRVRNVYAHTREECEVKLAELIAEMKAELAELKQKNP